jgi:hypothetical protein
LHVGVECISFSSLKSRPNNWLEAGRKDAIKAPRFIASVSATVDTVGAQLDGTDSQKSGPEPARPERIIPFDETNRRLRFESVLGIATGG